MRRWGTPELRRLVSTGDVAAKGANTQKENPGGGTGADNPNKTPS